MLPNTAAALAAGEIGLGQVRVITETYVGTTLDAAAATQLPAPDGAPVYHVDALQDTGQSLGDRLGRLFRRARWLSGDDQ